MQGVLRFFMREVLLSTADCWRGLFAERRRHHGLEALRIVLVQDMGIQVRFQERLQGRQG